MYVLRCMTSVEKQSMHGVFHGPHVRPSVCPPFCLSACLSLSVCLSPLVCIRRQRAARERDAIGTEARPTHTWRPYTRYMTSTERSIQNNASTALATAHQHRQSSRQAAWLSDKLLAVLCCSIDRWINRSMECLRLAVYIYSGHLNSRLFLLATEIVAWMCKTIIPFLYSVCVYIYYYIFLQTVSWETRNCDVD